MHGDVIVERRTPSVKIGQGARRGRRRVASCRPRGPARMRWVTWWRRPWARPRWSRTSSPGSARWRCGSPRRRPSMRSRAKARRCWRWTAPPARRRGCAPSPSRTRDLFRRPLLAPDLARFDAVVFDPPRAGAEAQAKCLAESVRAGRRRSIVQCVDLRARCGPAHRRRLHACSASRRSINFCIPPMWNSSASSRKTGEEAPLHAGCKADPGIASTLAGRPG